MKKKNYLSILFLILALTHINAQNLVEEFTLSAPENKVNSIYSNLIVIDARADSTNMGIIQKGAFNRKAFLVDKKPIKQQIAQVFNRMILVTPEAKGELILNLRNFKFAEVTGAFSENGYCYFRADLFAKKDSLYQKIDSIDTVLEVSAMDVTQKNIKNGSKKLIDFIASNLKFSKSGAIYSYDDILKIETLEKKKIPVYNSISYNDGIYLTFDNFKLQSPSINEFKVSQNKKGRVTGLKHYDREGKLVDINPNDIYCFINQGIIYISTSYGFYTVTYKENDFYFEGKAKVNAKTGNVLLASTFFGIFGGLIATSSTDQFLMKIDHLNGATVQIKKIE